MSHIPFAQRYREQLRRIGRPQRPPEHWDARAAALSATVFDGAYLSGFVARLALDGCATLLDVGCGPGTIALTVAPRLEHVYALDFSAGMLACLREQARLRGVTNVTPIHLGWEDDWSGVPVCDVVVASRSCMLPDLEAALVKVNARARVRACVTYPADGTMLPLSVHRELGRELPPDYLCALGILHDLGYQPTLDYLPGKNRLAGCATFEALCAKVADALGELSEAELLRLRAHYDASRDSMLAEPMRWALFSWEARA